VPRLVATLGFNPPFLMVGGFMCSDLPPDVTCAEQAITHARPPPACAHARTRTHLLARS
jgi:hypothetical protein